MDSVAKMYKSRGAARGKKEMTLHNLKNLMKATGKSLEKAMDALLIAEEDREYYRSAAAANEDYHITMEGHLDIIEKNGEVLGRKEAIIRNLDSLTKTSGISLNTAMDYLFIPNEEREGFRGVFEAFSPSTIIDGKNTTIRDSVNMNEDHGKTTDENEGKKDFLLEVIKNLVETTNKPVEDIMADMMIPEKDCEYYREQQ